MEVHSQGESQGYIHFFPPECYLLDVIPATTVERFGASKDAKLGSS